MNPDKKLIEYIEKRLSKGISREEIEKKLLSVGWSKEAISEAFAANNGALNPRIASEERAVPSAVLGEKISFNVSARGKAAIAIAVLLVVFSAAFIIFGSGGAGNGKAGEMLANDFGKSSFNVGITTPKENYLVGEEFAGRGIVGYEGKLGDFRGIVIATQARKGYLGEHVDFAKIVSVSVINGSMSDANTLLDEPLKAFRIKEKEYISLRDYFDEAGTYVFSVNLYDCDSVEKKLNVRCVDARARDVVQYVQPIESASKTVVANGPAIEPECSADSDCNAAECNNCTMGKRKCLLPEALCVDCFSDSGCYAGYSCESGMCIDVNGEEAGDGGAAGNGGAGRMPGTSDNKIDCTQDFACFIDAANDCSPAKMLYIYSLNLEGVIHNKEMYYEITGLQEGKCSFYFDAGHDSIEFTSELVLYMIEFKKTLEEIEADRAAAEEQANLREGKEGSCLFSTDELASILGRWEDEVLAESDWANGNCTGSYFEV